MHIYISPYYFPISSMDRITTFWWSTGAFRCRDDSAGPALRSWAVLPAGETVEDQAVENWLMLLIWGWVKTLVPSEPQNSW